MGDVLDNGAKIAQTILMQSPASYLSSLMKKDDGTENFSVGTSVLVVIILIVVFIYAMLIYSSYVLMGKDSMGLIHGVLTFFLGTIWVSVCWIWGGMSGRRLRK